MTFDEVPPIDIVLIDRPEEPSIGAGEGNRRLGVHRPVRDQERAGASIEECTRQARQRLGAFGAAGGSVAGRQDYPIGVELEAGDLGGGEIAIISLAPPALH
jgi:hypothetical protein